MAAVDIQDRSSEELSPAGILVQLERMTRTRSSAKE